VHRRHHGGSVNRKNLGPAFKIRGNAHDDSGHYDRAIGDYGQVIAINPADGDVFNNRGATCGAQG
jgi:tetratricopeptide (TPR) repeat protein